MRYVSLDVETTGLNPETCQVIEIGAVCDDMSIPWDEVKAREGAFHCIVHHDQIRGEPFALQMNVDILREMISEETVRPEKVAGNFRNWLNLRGWGHRDRVLFAGKNFAYDKSMLTKLPDWSRLIPSFHRNLDPAMLFLDPINDEVPPSLGECLKRMGASDSIVKHRAVDDAIDVVRLLRYGLNHENFHKSKRLTP